MSSKYDVKGSQNTESKSILGLTEQDISFSLKRLNPTPMNKRKKEGNFKPIISETPIKLREEDLLKPFKTPLKSLKTNNFVYNEVTESLEGKLTKVEVIPLKYK
jgi:hypothetical protein